MAANRNQFSITKGLSNSFRAQWVVASGGAATISQGSPTKITAADAAIWVGEIIPMVDGDGATGQRFCGIAATNSTDTASAEGIVDTWYPVPGLIYRGNALVAANVDTQTEVNDLMGKRVVFDLTSSVWTVDTAAADALANCVVIVGGNVPSAEVLFIYAQKGTVGDTSTVI